MITRWLILLPIIALFFHPNQILAQTEDWRVDLFESRIQLQQSGVAHIEEQIQVDFGSLEKHGIFRDLPYQYRDADGTRYTEIVIEKVLRNGQDVPYERAKSDAYIRLKIGDANTTISGKQEYRIDYTVSGVINSFPDYDELYWNVMGNDWSVPISKAAAYVTLPQPGLRQIACYQGFAGSKEACDSTQSSKQQASFVSTRSLTSGEDLTIAVGWNKGMVPVLRPEAPKEPAEILWEEWQKPAYWLWGALASIVGAVLPVWWWWRRGRDWWWSQPGVLESGQTAWLKPLFHKPQVVVEFTPPLDLRPAQMGVLLDERADTIDITSTIIDLASRGYLTIKELEKQWIFGSQDYELNLTDKPRKELLSFERLLLDRLFGTGSSVTLSSLKNSFHEDLAAVKNAVYDDLMQRRYFVSRPQTTRYIYLGIALGLLAIGGGLVWASFSLVWAWLIVAALFFVLMGIVTLLVAPFMPQKTAEGYEAYRRILGYRLFISTAEKYRQQFFEQKNIFTTVLPYAMMFGLTEKFAKAMQQLGFVPPQPSWYYGLHAFNVNSFSQDINTVSKTLSSTMASAPHSSGSGGGGSAGGGFGGGGGGSW